MGNQCIYEEFIAGALRKKIMFMIQFFGKIHPLLVHLPIGIFLFGILLKGYEWYQKSKIDTGIFKLLLLANLFSSVLSVITGLILFSDGDYDMEAVLFHRNLAIVFSFISFILYFFSQKKWSVYFWILGLISLIITGHLGGNLTHGEDYLSFKTQKIAYQSIDNIQEAVVYEDIIKPILNEKCVACHSAKKQKGKLRLDEKDFLLKGGKTGTCINFKKPTESLLLQRILLPEREEEHMPPKGKTQLTDNELKIIDWWVKSGGDFNKKVKELNPTDSDKKALLSFQSVHEQSRLESMIPDEKMAIPSAKALDILKKAGVVILPIMTESNYLSMTIFENNFGEKELEALQQISKNILVMNAQGLKNKAIFNEISRLINLKKLNLSGASLGDADIQKLSNLKALQILNLSGTDVTEKGVGFLKENQNLKNIYLFGSKFDTKQFKTIKLQFPKTLLDTGGYIISEADSLKFVL